MIENIPLLPLRGLLVFPSMVLHIDVGRDRSVKALEQAMLDDSKIFLVTQKDLRVETPLQKDLYEVGTVSKVKQMLKLPNGTLRILVEGIERGKIEEYSEGQEFTSVNISTFEKTAMVDTETEALMRTLLV